MLADELVHSSINFDHLRKKISKICCFAKDLVIYPVDLIGMQQSSLLTTGNLVPP